MTAVDTLFGDDAPQRHVVRLRWQPVQSLDLEGDADQQRPPPVLPVPAVTTGSPDPDSGANRMHRLRTLVMTGK